MFDDDTKLILTVNVNNLSASIDRMEAAIETGDAKALVTGARLANSVLSMIGPLAENLRYEEQDAEREREVRRKEEQAGGFVS